MLASAGCLFLREGDPPQQERCTQCHGSSAPERGPSERSAPPRDTLGNEARASRGVGAHLAHLRPEGPVRPVACAECHLVPQRTDAPGHADTPAPAEVLFTGAAVREDREGPLGTALTMRDGGVVYESEAQRCTVWCHAPGRAEVSPAWTEVGALGCTGCHGLPPPPPHPRAAQCSLCHSNAGGASGQEVRDPALHVNGVAELSVSGPCHACHGTEASPAPPPDTTGSTSTESPGVGAHQAHLVGTGLSRPLRCEECHVVPAQALAPGHPNGVTEVVFSGMARAAGAQPSYAHGSCGNTYCHDTRLLASGQSTGGLFQAPAWTRVDGSQRQCDACHGNPPPPPHPQDAACGRCHPTIGDGGTVLLPLRHLDGRLDLKVP